MNSSPETIPIQRYIAVDSHKEYVFIGGMNDQQKWSLRPRRVQMSRFRDWAHQNLKPGDAVVLETTGNVWDIYDVVAPLVSKTVVAHAGKVRQIAEARVKTDKEDVKRLITLLIANIVPEVWVPPRHVRELRSLISFRWRLSKQITMSKNRLHSVVQRFNLNPPEGQLLADKNLSWWDQQEFSDLTSFQVECDRGIVDHLEAQKANVDQKLAELSNTAPWASDMVFLMQIPGFGLLFSMIVLAAIGDISRFDSPKKLVGYAGLGAGVHDSGKKHQDKSTLAPAQTAGAVQVSLKQAVKNSAGLSLKLPGLPFAVIPTEKLNMSISHKPNTLIKPLLLWPARCWFLSGTSSLIVSHIAMLMMTPLLTRWSSGLSRWI